MIEAGSGPRFSHVLIVGPSKTGTTGVYAAVKAALRAAGADLISVFEPPSPQRIGSALLLAPECTLLTKATVNRLTETIRDPLMFDRRIMTVRDPRDVLISMLLFRPLTKRSVQRTQPDQVAEFVAALERKEADPSAISVRALFELAQRLTIGDVPYKSLAANLKRQRRLLEKMSFQVVRYEDFVAGNLAAISTYLSIPVEAQAAHESSLSGHIARSFSSGDYAHWFRADDLEYFNEQFGEFIEAFGYDRASRLAEVPTIDPAVSSDYVRKGYARRRESLHALASDRAADWLPATTADPHDLERLASAADDGDATAALRITQVIQTGVVDTVGGRGALDWAQLAARLGQPDGMAATVELLRAGDPLDAESRRAIGRWTMAEALYRADHDHSRMRRSAAYRVGTQLVDIARSPRRNAAPAARELVAVWRGRSGRRAAQRLDASANS